MSEKTREAIQSLKPVVEQLNVATDDASATLEEADAEFRNLGLGIEASVFLAEGNDFENGDLNCIENERVLLEHRNGADGWGLYICRYTVRGSDDHPDQVWLLESESPASRVARELKLQAVEKLDALVGALRRKAAEYVGEEGGSR